MLTKDTREVWLIQPPHHLMWINSLRVGEAERGAASFPVTGEGMWWSPSTKKALICETHEGKEPAAPPHSFQAAIVSSLRAASLIALSRGKSHAIFSTQKHSWVKRQTLYEMPLFLMYDQSSCTCIFGKTALNLNQRPQPFPEPHGQAFISSENTTRNPHTTSKLFLSHRNGMAWMHSEVWGHLAESSPLATGQPCAVCEQGVNSLGCTANRWKEGLTGHSLYAARLVAGVT